MPKALDLTEKRFGQLIAIKKAPSQKGKTYWICNCNCGNQVKIQTGNLTSGVTKTCGKCRKNFAPSKENEEKICILCKTNFISNNIKRLYCYECSPSGLSPSEALRFKKRKLKSILIQYKGGKCCKCGYNKYQGALQFHHLDPKQKEFTISHINLNDTNFSIDKLKEELDKCILLCANCHFEEHGIEE